MKSNQFISVVAALRDDFAVLRPFVHELNAALSANYHNYEVVLVDDWSQDETVGTATTLLQEYPSVRLIRLSRRHGSDVAITAGLEATIGDFVVVMRADCDPP